MDRRQAINLLARSTIKSASAPNVFVAASPDVRQQAVALLHSGMVKEAAGLRDVIPAVKSFFRGFRGQSGVRRDIPATIRSMLGLADDVPFNSRMASGTGNATQATQAVRNTRYGAPQPIPRHSEEIGQLTRASQQTQPGSQAVGLSLRPASTTLPTQPGPYNVAGGQAALQNTASASRPATSARTLQSQQAWQQPLRSAQQAQSPEQIAEGIRRSFLGSGQTASQIPAATMQQAGRTSPWWSRALRYSSPLLVGGGAYMGAGLARPLYQGSAQDRFVANRDAFLRQAEPYMAELERLQNAVDSNSPNYNQFDGLDLTPSGSASNVYGNVGNTNTLEGMRAAARSRIQQIQNRLRSGNLDGDRGFFGPVADHIYTTTGGALDLGGVSSQTYRNQAIAAAGELGNNTRDITLTRAPTSQQDVRALANDIVARLNRPGEINLPGVTDQQAREYLRARLAELNQMFDSGAAPQPNPASPYDWANATRLQNMLYRPRESDQMQMATPVQPLGNTPRRPNEQSLPNWNTQSTGTPTGP